MRLHHHIILNNFKKGALVKATKSEVTYFILSIILIALAGGIYFVFGNIHTSTSSSQPKTSISSSSSQADLEANAQALLAEAQANPSAEAISSAQDAINKLSDEAKKTDLQSQLDAVSAELTNRNNAESAVATAESEQTSQNVDAAQAAIDAVGDQATKDQLQARLDAVSNAIAAAVNKTEDTTVASDSSDNSDSSTINPNNTTQTPSSVVTDGNYTYDSY